MGEKGEKRGYEVCPRTSQYLPKARFLQQIGIWTIYLSIEEDKAMAICAKLLELNGKVQFYSPFSVYEISLFVTFRVWIIFSFSDISVLVTFPFW